MPFTQQQTLVYSEHSEELKVLARIIDSLGRKDSGSALEVAMARHAYLLEAQKPRLKDFDPREALAEARQRP